MAALKLTKKNLLWAYFFFILAVASAIALAFLISIPADEKHALIFGYSLQRILLFVGVAIPLLVAFYLALRAAFRPLWVENQLEPLLRRITSVRWFSSVCAALVLIGWLALFMPPYWFGFYHAYFVRLRPIIVWLGFCSALSLAVYMLWIKGWRPAQAFTSMRDQRGLLGTTAVILAFLCGLWIFISLTGLGIKPDPYFWNEAGVPVLGLQLIASLLLVAAASRLVFLRDPARNYRWIDWGVVLLVWLFAFLLWQFTKMPRSFLAPGPYPPNWIYYPYSDAEYYDYSAQYLLLGQGISNGEFQDKPVYVFILALLHLIAGQNYDLLISLQVALLGLAPVGLYLLGSTLHSRQAGLLVALMTIFQQRNAIAATLDIQVSHSKLLLTEYPGAVFLIFFCLLIVRWFQSPEPRLGLLLTSGGILGLTSLVRPNALLLAPVMILLVLARCRRAFKYGALASALFALVFILTLLPWNLVTPKGYTAPYLIVKAKALFDTRYQPIEPSTRFDDPRPEMATAASKTAFKLSAVGSNQENQRNGEGQDTPIIFIANHFFHNEIMGLFILPHRFILQDLDHTLQAPYWQDISNWQGQLEPGSYFLIFLNLGLVSLGTAVAWRRWRLAGLIPLVIQLGYFLANAVVRNSGARYLVPVDWVLLIYFGLGIVQAFAWLSRVLGSKPFKDLGATPEKVIVPLVAQTGLVRWRQVIWISALFLTLGGALPLSKFIFPGQLPEKSPDEILHELQNIHWQDERVVGWLKSIEGLQDFDQTGIAVVDGRGLYPRFYGEGEGEPSGELSTAKLPASGESHLAMRILARDSTYLAILPMPHSPPKVKDGAVTAVIGCRYGDGRYIDAAAVLIQSDGGEVYWRSSETELSCPLHLP